MKGFTAGLDLVDLLLIVGLVSLIGGIAALNRPAAAIVFGGICLWLWDRKVRGRRKWDG